MRQLLKLQKLGTSSECPTCGCGPCGEESICHALITCPVAVAVWFLSLFGFRCDNVVTGLLSEWYLSLVKSMDKDSLCRAVMIIWQIWNHHNSALHDSGAPITPAGIDGCLNFF